jgi:hypothetical protein
MQYLSKNNESGKFWIFLYSYWLTIVAINISLFIDRHLCASNKKEFYVFCNGFNMLNPAHSKSTTL